MEEKTLLKVSLAAGLLGLVVLYFISSGIDLEAIKSIEEIEEEEVKLSGRVGKISENGAVVFLEILNEKIEETEVVLFKDGGVDLIEGDYVEILGTVEDYEGKKEIIGNKVIKKGYLG